MPLDAITISALCDELRPQLEGARIDKVQQPERDAVLLSVRSLGRNRRLLIAAGAGNARLHFTAESIENPRRAADVLHAAAQASDRREDRFDKPAGA